MKCSVGGGASGAHPAYVYKINYIIKLQKCKQHESTYFLSDQTLYNQDLDVNLVITKNCRFVKIMTNYHKLLVQNES